ncbi:MAG: HRDC domain-containing protein [Ignavibacteriales bacterium]|nr:HRDC domain-containing protein [Ignavibacteriales bacterium]
MITNKGLEFLKEHGLVEEKKPVVDYEQNLELFHMLKEVRAKTAAKFNQQPFLICPDETIREIISRKPDTKFTLMGIPGFTERMYNKIGEDILKTIEEFSLLYGNDGKRVNKENALASELEPVLKMVKEGYSMQEIAKLTKTAEAITAMQIETIIEFVTDVDFSKVVDSKLKTAIAPYYKRGIREMKELKKLLNDAYSFPELRIALALLKVSV